MPAGDSPVYVASFSYGEPDYSNYQHAEVVEVGGRGKLVQLWQVIYHFYDIVTANAALIIADALSEDPNHELAPPATIAAFAESRALYGRSVWTTQATQVTAVGYYHSQWQNQIVPLYGIIRPRRQLWVTYAVQGQPPALGKRSMELYYSVVPDLPGAIKDAINRKRGKYRRS
jgi:hypothetical protein